jgi:8-amino-7-oxononanoate synthase
VELAGAPHLSFCSNDYLGLADHPEIAAAAARAARDSGYGSSASRLVSGDLPEHRALEDALATFLRAPAALVFPTGYQANVGTLTALASREDFIASDASNHASLIDGCRLSRARVAVYPHLDTRVLEDLLSSAAHHRRRFILTESLFSMDGDPAPLSRLAELAHDHQAALVVDEAHALGVLGPGGRGLCAHQGVTPDVLIGTLGKAFAALGGFVAGSRELIQLLLNRARTFIFTTGTPPPVAAAAHAALRIAASPDGDARRERLLQRIATLQQALPGLRRAATPGPIVPVLLGSDQAATAASRQLRDRGLFVQAIRPPTVPEGTARLRITLSAAHSEDSVQLLARSLRDLSLA